MHRELKILLFHKPKKVDPLMPKKIRLFVWVSSEVVQVDFSLHSSDQASDFFSLKKYNILRKKYKQRNLRQRQHRLQE